jgi:hypothetical protein
MVFHRALPRACLGLILGWLAGPVPGLAQWPAVAPVPPLSLDPDRPESNGPGRFLFPRPFGAWDEPGLPGIPPPRGRPRPGSIFNPGASGPGISQGEGNFLDGALDPRTGWPFVLLDHFRPRRDRLAAFWIVSTRECPQEMGADPWPCLKVRRFDENGDLVAVPPSALFEQTVGKPVFIQVQGNLTTADMALGGLLWSHSWLQRHRAMLPETVVVAFDWPSQRVHHSDIRDIHEKGRRAYVAAYQLARFVQGFPHESRICLLGQSYGGRVVPSALHLLGGGALDSQSHDPKVRLPGIRPDLHLRAIVLAGASDHHWLDPGARLDRALCACEGMLNLHNRRDEALRLYPLLLRGGHHHALGQVGLTNRDFARLGPRAARYAEYDIDEQLGREHTLLDAVANPVIARRMAPYLWAPDPGPTPVVPGEPATLSLVERTSRPWYARFVRRAGMGN